MIVDRSKITEINFDKLLELLKSEISLVPKPLIEQCISEARVLVNDPKDILYLATALCTNVDGIWTNDKDFSSQEKIKIFSTKALVLHIQD